MMEWFDPQRVRLSRSVPKRFDVATCCSLQTRRRFSRIEDRLCKSSTLLLGESDYLHLIDRANRRFMHACYDEISERATLKLSRAHEQVLLIGRNPGLEPLTASTRGFFDG